MSSVGFWHGAMRVAARNLTVWRHYAAASAVGNFGEPLLYLIALGYGLGGVVPPIDGQSYAEFIAPGLVVTTVMYTATFEGTFGTYTRLVTQGTFEAMMATPISVPEIVAGEVLWGGIKCTFGAAVVLAVIAGFGLVPSWWSLGVLPLAFVSGLLFYAMAMLTTGLSKSYEFFNYYFTLIVAPMYLFSGVFFPLDRAPEWARAGSLVLPLTHVVAISRACVRGTPTVALAFNALVILAYLVVCYAIAARLMSKRLTV
jgi:lipooligosaccharide transport system permease protein